MQKHGAHRFGFESREHRTRVLGENAPSRRNASRPEPIVDDERPFPANLQPNEEDLRADFEALEEKGTAPRTDLELHRPATRSHDFAGIDFALFGKARGSVVTGGL